MEQKGSSDDCWKSTDQHGNTVLHLAASTLNAACVDCILDQDFGTQLLEVRNNRGETPLEKLQFKLEELRTQRSYGMMIAHVSDRFEGHSENAVRCLILLKGLDSVESFVKAHGADALLRLTRGCTCGQCLEGFLSPRMSQALQCQAKMGHEMIAAVVNDWLSPEAEYLQEDCLGYLPSRVLKNLDTNKSMRQGFASLWLYVATCLKEGMVPHQSNVLEVYRRESEWPPVTKNFLERGGTVESVFLGICRLAMFNCEEIEDGLYEMSESEEAILLSECRNDLEFGYVSGMCGYRRISRTLKENRRGDRVDEDDNIVDSLF